MTSTERISLVIPVQDEEATVVALLQSVGRQVRVPDEVVLVDAGSRDATVERAASVPMPCPVKIVRPGRVFPGVARNAGVTAARHDWLAFTDGGICLRPDWLLELAAAADDVTDVVFGSVEPVCDTLFRQCAALAYVSPRDSLGMHTPFIASCLMRRAAFAQAGGFPSFRAAEDLIFLQRLFDRGARVATAPRAVVRWEIAGDLRSTFNRFALYSFHNLLAGWGRHWHLGVARLYAVLAVAIAAATWFYNGPWLWLGLPAFFLARSSKAAWVKRGSFEFPTLRPARVLGAAGLLVVIDAATALGFLRWLLARMQRAAPT